MKLRLILITLLAWGAWGGYAQKNATFYIQRAQSRMAVEDYQGALRDFNEAITLDPNNVQAYVNRGMLNARYLYNKRSALSDFNKAIELDPKDPSGYYNRGALYKDAQDYASALKDYNKVIDLNASFAGAYYNRATLNYFFIGNKQDACTDWKKAEELGYNEASEWYSKYCKEAK